MKVGVIGTGSMGSMLTRVWLGSGTLTPAALMVANRSPAALSRLLAAHPGLESGSPADVADWADVLWLCVKPGDTFALLDALTGHLRPESLLVLVSGAIPIERVEATVAAKVAKVIPSVAQEASAGATLVVYGSRIGPEEEALLTRLLSGISRPVTVREEQLRTAADISSCGPAFLAYVAQQMAQSALVAQPELPPETVAALVRETLLATALLLTQNAMAPEEIIRRVRVPGGVTAAGLAVLERLIPGAWDGVFAATRALEESKLRHL